MIILLLNSILFTMSSYIIFHSLRTLNYMHMKTNHLVRVFFILMPSIAFYEIVAMLNGNAPCLADYVFISLISLSMFFDDRNNFEGQHYQGILK